MSGEVLTVRRPERLSGRDRPRPLLEARDLRVTFTTAEHAVQAVRGIDLSLEPGKSLVLLGESGCGKSVSLRAILRLYRSSAARIGGSVWLDGRPLHDLDDRQMQGIRGGEVGMVQQDPGASLDPLRRIDAQLIEVLRRHRVAADRRSARARAEELLARVGIRDPHRVARSLPYELSGGMRQRAVIAIAVACNPRLLLADEPTTALDATVQAQVLALFDSLRRELGMGLIMATHDVDVARQVADQIAVMYAGRVVESGPADEVLDRPVHPYTTGLLNAVPRPDIPRGQLAAIDGRHPGPGELLGGGCAFAPRCPLAEPSCSNEVPDLMRLGQRAVACPVKVGALDPERTVLSSD